MGYLIFKTIQSASNSAFILHAERPFLLLYLFTHGTILQLTKINQDGVIHI